MHLNVSLVCCDMNEPDKSMVESTLSKHIYSIILIGVPRMIWANDLTTARVSSMRVEVSLVM